MVFLLQTTYILVWKIFPLIQQSFYIPCSIGLSQMQLFPVIQEIQFNCKEKVFYCKSDQTLAKIAQRGYGVSNFGDIQNLTRYGPE